MKRNADQFAFPATLIAVMAVFLAVIFFAHADLSYAAAGKKKTSAVARTSAVEYTEAQIKQLQDALNITKDQEALWNNLTLVMRENAKNMDAFSDARKKQRAEGTKTLNSVEHMKLHRDITKAHFDQMEKLIPPFEAFYSSMSEEQKNITDNVFRTGKYGKQKRK